MTSLQCFVSPTERMAWWKMPREQKSAKYAGRSMTLDELLDARSAIETWANKTYHFSNPQMYDDICHVLTLAQGMWYKLSKEQADE